MDVLNIASIDFETGSHEDLKRTGAAKYAEHSSTRVICMAWQLPTMSKPRVWREGEPFPWLLIEWVRNGRKVSGWNVMFEYWIWNLVLIKQCPSQPIPKLEIDQLVDTMAVAAFNGLPLALETAAEALPHLGIQKDKQGKALMMRMSRPRDPKTDRWWHLEDPEKFDRLCDYCKQDVVVERAILKDLLPLPKIEQRIWQMDATTNARGMLLDGVLVGNMQSIAAVETGKMDAQMAKLTHGYVPNTRAVGRLLIFAQGMEPDIKSLAKDQLAVWIEKTRWSLLKEVLQLRERAAKSSVAKLTAMENFASVFDGRMRGLYQYYGAFRTGRDAGRGPQIQNFPRGTVKDVDALIEFILKGGDGPGIEMFFGVGAMEALSSALRGCITVPKGKWFCSYDFSQIEARVTPWLAGSEELLEAFREGKDIYVIAAAGIYKVPEDAVTAAQRQIGKVAVLALGFGGGVGAFQNMAKVYGLEMTDEEAEEIKVQWREANPEIVGLWYQLDRAAIATIKTGRKHTVGYLTFEKHGRNLHMILPSRRPLIYRDAEIGVGKFGGDCVTYMGVDQYTRQWTRIDTYGGKWVENATQAVARDVMKSAALRVDALDGVDLLGPIHDELLCEIDDVSRETNIAREMNRPMVWAQGLPIAADGYLGKRFKKG